MRFGYLCLEEGEVSIHSPLVVSPDSMQAAWVDTGSSASSVSRAMIDAWLSEQGVRHGIDEGAIERLTSAQESGKIEIVARGTLPQSGDVQLVVDPAPRSPRRDDEGVLDLTDGPLAPRVEAGQELARWPACRDGVDVYGRRMVVEGHALEAGSNVAIETVDGLTRLTARIDGVLYRHGDQLDVLELLTLTGDVVVNTGRLEFAGEVYVDGSVRLRLLIEAGGAVTVAGEVAPGSCIAAAANITVSAGITGHRTQLRAGGSVEAQFIEDGHIDAAGDILLQGFALNADLRAGRRICIGSDGNDGTGGMVSGGRLWAGEGVRAGTIGRPDGTATLIAVGIEPEESRHLERLDHNLATSYEHILRLLRRFQLSSIDVAQIRNLIQASRGPQRKALAHNARQLARLAQLYRDLQQQQEALRQKVGKVSADVRADVVHPGVSVRIGTDRYDVRELLRDVCFHVNGNGLQPH